MILRKQQFGANEASILRDFFIVDQDYLDRNNKIVSQIDGGEVRDLDGNPANSFDDKL